ncbi:TPA: hypothetical protein N0F65_004129 [Lagenidium giganteum]|uniref:Uncharacterized protein n=1 Tax=Lagenidium giganteum TaxID=4803 RepID=A0AAV2ZAA8_9STRA|nr:TPA: hypothetical protein N0F65_004129 [Lagenidium giganteum]
MQATFEEKNLEHVANGTATIDLATASDVDKSNYTKAQGAIKRMILDSLDESLIGNVLGKNNGTDMWRALSDHLYGKAGTAVTTTQQLKLQH